LTQGLSPADAFFINVSSMTAGVSVQANNLNLGVHVGFLDAQVKNGSVNLSATVGLLFSNPSSTTNVNGNITLSALQGNPAGSVVTIQPPTSSLTATLPVTTNLFSVTGTPAITLSDADLFSGAPLDVSVNSDFTNLLSPFDNLTSGDFSTLFSDLGSSLQHIASSLNPTSIPLVGKQISDIVDFTQTTSGLINQLKSQILVGSGALPANGQLSGDAQFAIAVGSAGPVNVTVSAASTTSDTSINDLVTAINTALTSASLSSKFQAVTESGQIELIAIDPTIAHFSISGANTTAANVLGFSNNQTSTQPMNIQAMVPVLANTLKVSTNALQITFDPTTEALSFNVDIKGNYSQSSFLNFGNNLGPLTIAGSATAMFSAGAEVKGTLGINLKALLADPSGLLSDIFLANNPSVTVSASIAAPTLNLSAALGMLSIGVQNGSATIAIGTGVALDTMGTSSNPPNTLSLSDLASASTTSSSLLTVQPITATVTGSLPLSVSGVPGIQVDPSNPPAIMLGLATPNDLGSFQVTTNVAFNNLLSGFVSAVGDQLSSAFSDGDVLGAVTSLVKLLGNFGPLSAKLPIVNKSVEDLVGIANNLNNVVSALTGGTNPQTLIGELSGTTGLLAQLNTAIQNLPAADQAQIAMAPGYLQTIITQSGQAAQNQFGNANDALFTAANAAAGALQDAINSLQTLSQPPTQSQLAALNAVVTSRQSDLPSVQNLGPAISKALGLPANSVTITFANVAIPTAGTDKALEIKLHLTPSASTQVSLAGLSGTNLGPLALMGGGTINVAVGGTLELDFGYDLVSNTPFLLNSTTAGVTVGISTSNLQLTAKLGGVGLISVGTGSDPASFTIQDQAGDGGPATFSLSLPTNSTLTPFADLLSDPSILTTSLNGQLHANLPIYFQGSKLGAVTVAVNQQNFDQPSQCICKGTWAWIPTCPRSAPI